MKQPTRYRVSLTRGTEPTLWTSIWDGAAPLVLGYPLRFALERAGKSEVRVRSLASPLGKTQTKSAIVAKLSNRADAVLDLEDMVPSAQFVLSVSAIDLTGELAPSRELTSSLRQELISRESPLETRNLKRSALGASGGIAVMLALSAIFSGSVPEAPEEELIPAQFASAVLSKPAEPVTAAPSQSAPKAQAQNTQVAQALQSKSVSNAMSKLLQGGMTRLLAQSDLVSARRSGVFSQKSAQAALSKDSDLKTSSTQVAEAGDVKSANYKDTASRGLASTGGEFVSLQDDLAQVESGLTKEEVGREIHKHLSEIRYCYESAMVRSAQVEGKLLVDFVIGASGAIKSAQVKTSNLGDPRLDDCIVRRLVKWKFPTPKGGVDVAVAYPFIFKALGR